MNIVKLIRRYECSVEGEKTCNNIHLIRVVNMIISELCKEPSGIANHDRLVLVKTSHAFYAPDTNEQNRKECLNKIINLLAIYSEGENGIQDIETELLKLAGV